jgi:hypothetical protein
MAIRNVDPVNSFEQWRQETNSIASDAGDVSTLTPTATNLTSAINEHESDIGNLVLTTTATNLTSAINEHETLININTSDITTNLNSINVNASDIITNANNITTNATNITLKEDIGVAVAMAIALGG